jgi:hypothetical protein
MLHVRYVIFRGTPPPDVNPSFVDADYWVWVNDRAMPRAFVPRRVQVIAEAQDRLDAMNRPDFGTHLINVANPLIQTLPNQHV